VRRVNQMTNVWDYGRSLVQKLRGRRGRKITKPFLLANFPVFCPDSANYWVQPEMTYRGANAFPAQAAAILEREGLLGQPRVLSAAAFGGATDGARFQALLRTYNSSKTDVGYEAVYAAIFDHFVALSEPRILEIGIGTTTKGLVSMIDATCVPGGSLRAMRDYLPKALIFGADIDENILFSEDRIRTAFVDQTDPNVLASLPQRLGAGTFDFIIDDGLHSPEANLNTLLFALGVVRPGGWILIEDIPRRARPVWRLLAPLLSTGSLETWLIETKIGLMFVARRLPVPAAM